MLNENDDEVVDVSNAEYCNNSDQSDEVVSDDVHKLIDEQKSDETLSGCRDMAHQGKGNYVISQGLLYHKGKVEDQSVCHSVRHRRKNIDSSSKSNPLRRRRENYDAST